MKRLFLSILLAIVVAIPQESSAQIDLGKALGLLLGESAQQQTPSRSPLAEIAEKAPAAKDLCHTWAYDRVYLKYLGTSPLADAALQQVDGSAQAALKNAGKPERSAPDRSPPTQLPPACTLARSSLL